MKHDTTLYRYTDYAQLVPINIGITERISHFFVARQSLPPEVVWDGAVEWCWLVVHSHPQATKDQQHRKRWWRKWEKVNMLSFCGSEDGFQ